VTRHYSEDWEELARREPYFAVLTEERFLRGHIDDDARRAFFASGEADVEKLFADIGPIAPASALDFGCGVGRLTLPLARRIPRVAGCDIAPQMLAEARRNAELLGITNARFVSSLDELNERFDLICSLIVFQHIPVREGLATLTRLLELLAPGGVAALHFTIRRPGSIFKRLARALRASMPWIHRIALRLEGKAIDLPYMQMNAYDAAEIERRIIEITGNRPRILPRNEGAIEGALFLIRGAA